MKLTKFTNLLVLGLVLTVAAVGCRKRPEDLSRIPGYKPMTEVAESTNSEYGLTNASGTESTNLGVAYAQSTNDFRTWPENREVFAAYTVHFAFDSSTVRKGEESKLASVADYMKKHAGDAVRVEGYCDERGTAEYNRALGERRALALREGLIHLGISQNMVETISYGFDRPLEPGHNEAAWSKNRRGEFILLTPPAKVAP
jgi:peptidoglycan-associated lipoprotein